MTGEKINELLKTVNTPVYVFDMGNLHDRIQYLKDHLPKRVSLCYAIKANAFLLKDVEAQVDYLEICSPGEYYICEKLGLQKEKFVISGVNKDTAFIEELIENKPDVGCYTIESLSQFELIYNAVKKANRRVTILPRLTSGNQFGLDLEDLLSLIKEYKDDPLLDISGIQFFSGTQKTSLKKQRRELVYVDEVIEKLKAEYDFTVKKLEFGGGFPVSYFEGEEFDEDAYLKEFSDLLNEMQFKGPITLELGRSIAASCGTYLTRVVDTKCNKKELYAIVDGGMHQIVYYGQSMAMKHPMIKHISKGGNEEIKSWNICGSLCSVNDILVKRYPFSNLSIGDVLAFENAGAYCVTEGISLFLSRDIPAVVLMDEDGNFDVVRNQIQTETINAPIIK